MTNLSRQTNPRLITQMTGKGFELTVAGELLFRGFVCNLAIVDAGVDLVARNRKGKSINIQVKGRNFSGHGSGVETVQISARSYNDPSARPDFLIIGIRYTKGAVSRPAYGNKAFLILSHKRFEELRRLGYVGKSEDDKLKLQLNVTFDEETGVPKRVVLQQTYGKSQDGTDVTESLDAWGEIEDVN